MVASNVHIQRGRHIYDAEVKTLRVYGHASI